jgi:predicted dehydrogenase
MGYKVGIIGAGAIVESGHLPALKAIPGISVDWLYDVNPARGKLLSTMYEVPSISESTVQKAIESVDVCLLSIPYGVRMDYIQKISSAGKAIYVEKPFALSVKEHNHYCSLFPPYKLSIGYQRRTYKFVKLLSSIVSSGMLGALKEVSIKQGYFSLKGGKGYLADAKLSGGGVIIESAIHVLDQILLIAGATDVNVESANAIMRNGIDFDSSFISGLTTTSGNVIVKAEVSALRNLQNGMLLEFENGTVSANIAADPEVKFFDKRGMLQDITFNYSDRDEFISAASTVAQAFVVFWSDFFIALEKQLPNYTSGTNALLTTKWAEEIYSKIAENADRDHRSQ